MVIKCCAWLKRKRHNRVTDVIRFQFLSGREKSPSIFIYSKQHIPYTQCNVFVPFECVPDRAPTS